MIIIYLDAVLDSTNDLSQARHGIYLPFIAVRMDTGSFPAVIFLHIALKIFRKRADTSPLVGIRRIVIVRITIVVGIAEPRSRSNRC